jgi:archaellum component FlaC
MKRKGENMAKDKHIEDNFADMLALLKKKVQEKDEEVERLREENKKLRKKLSEIDPDFVLEETFKRR